MLQKFLLVVRWQYLSPQILENSLAVFKWAAAMGRVCVFPGKMNAVINHQQLL